MSKFLRILFVIQASLLTGICRAQKIDSQPAVIEDSLRNDTVFLKPVLRPLHKLAGAPDPFYSYFWEFGDGNFSFKQKPKHIYKDTGSYNVRLYATNNYDDGKAPPTRPKRLRYPKREKTMLASLDQPSIFSKDQNIAMRVNSMPLPGEEMVLLLGYRNTSSSQMKGSLYVFYNDKEFTNKNFEWLEARGYHDEKNVSSRYAMACNSPATIECSEEYAMLNHSEGFSLLSSSSSIFQVNTIADLIIENGSQYYDNKAWRFEQLNPNEERYLFISLRTIPEMIRDTNSELTVTGLYVPDDPAAQVSQVTLELQIVASHDPNRMMLRHRLMNYRFRGTERSLDYKILFQNTGAGHASTIKISTLLPADADRTSLKIKDIKPYCLPCSSTTSSQSCYDTLSSKDSLYFIFRNIYLPGIKQEDFSDPDSTTGFVKYSLNFSGKPPKLPFSTRSSIIFDKNEAVVTNRMSGDFRKGSSFSAIAGRNFILSKHSGSSDNYFFMGSGFSPVFSPWKKFLQWELFLSYRKQPEEISGNAPGRDTILNGQPAFYQARIDYQKFSFLSLWLTAFQVRYNLNDWAGGGIGVMGGIDLSEIIQSRSEYLFVLPSQFKAGKNNPSQSKYFINPGEAIFADIELGKVRYGPAIGLRYLYRFDSHTQSGWIYGIWRF